jgi:hypothetical protein
MLYEITFTRSIESADGRPETEEYSRIIDAPAARIDKTTGRPRFNNGMLGWIFEYGAGTNAEHVIVSAFDPLTINRAGDIVTIARKSELYYFNLGNMRAAKASLEAEVAARQARP